MPNYWILQPYDPKDKISFQRAWNYDLTHNTIASGWDEIGPEIVTISRLNHDELRRKIKEYYPERSENVRGMDATEIARWYREIIIGDIVIAKKGSGEMLAIGTVTKEGYYDRKAGLDRIGLGVKNYPNFIGINWQPITKRFVNRRILGRNTVIKKNEAEFQEILNSVEYLSIGADSFSGDPEFARGANYRREDIHNALGGQRQYGISTPSKYNVILLFGGQSGKEHGYHDGLREDGVYLYSGEGQKGDMTLTRGNAEIINHQRNGKELHLFEIAGNGIVKYIGQMAFIGFQELSIDSKGELRKTIQFELIPVTNSNAFDEDIVDLQNDDLETLRKKAMTSASEKTSAKERMISVRQRSAAIKLYSLKRANGACESCQADAPFIKVNGEPYLEVHHIKQLSDDGPDHPEFVIGICPNCHRRAHLGFDHIIVNESMMRLVELIEERIKHQDKKNMSETGR